MALRIIRKNEDPALYKPCKEVKKFDARLSELIDDMIETMNDADGVGLAAPQVGVLRRVCVIDIGEGPVELVNPVILDSSGEPYTTGTGPSRQLSDPFRSGHRHIATGTASSAQTGR